MSYANGKAVSAWPPVMPVVLTYELNSLVACYWR